MTDRIEIAGLKIARELHDFVASEALPGTGIGNPAFWAAFSAIVHDLAPRNRALLKKREDIQETIDRWHRDHRGPIDLAAYKSFLKEIGYLLEEGPDCASPVVQSSFSVRRRSALLITLTEDRAMAAAAMIGESRSPVAG